MIVRETRLSVLNQIDELLTGCGSCKKRQELNEKNGAVYSRTDGYCNRECPVGQELQRLGKQLIRSE